MGGEVNEEEDSEAAEEVEREVEAGAEEEEEEEQRGGAEEVEEGEVSRREPVAPWAGGEAEAGTTRGL